MLKPDFWSVPVWKVYTALSFIVTTALGSDGPVLTETYALSSDGKRLTITSSHTREGENAATFKRVYDRVQ